MGIIGRQSVKTTIVRLSTVFIGAFSILFAYDYDLEAYGLSQILLSSSILLSNIFSMGAPTIAIRYFSQFNDNKYDRSSLFFFLLTLGLIGAGLFGILLWTSLDDVLSALSNSGNNIELYRKFSTFVYILFVIQLGTSLLDTYLTNFGRITYPTIITRFTPKILLPAIIVIGYFQDWELTQTAIGVLVMQFIAFAGLVYYLISQDVIGLKFSIKKIIYSSKIKEIATYGAYGILGAISTKLIFQIDTVSLGAYVSKEEVGAYQILLFAATVITIGYDQIMKVTSPIVARQTQKNLIADVEENYKNVAKTSLAWGFFAFSVIAFSLTDVFSLLENKQYFTSANTIFILLAFGIFSNMMGSTNAQILSYSRYFKYNYYIAALLALSNVFLNWYLIAYLRMGLIGAALATTLSLSTVNIVRSILVYIFFRIHPLSRGLMATILLGAIMVVLISEIPDTGNIILNVFLRASLVSLAFLLFVLYSPYHPNIKELIMNNYKMILVHLKRSKNA
ncbi:hypothetical protein CEQ90_06495 [Lewinellaceae bacterium SD302]|nr:hypothetical protein CEQ90_06495 [Lewinellaceae bacterium SD302]